ncbi:MAG: DNA adenine methylase [Pyrinomonadaceae bacterium]
MTILSDMASAPTFTEDQVSSLNTSKEKSFIDRKVVNVASVKHRSPFRYPGGKTWLVPTIRQWFSAMPQPVKHFVEPFAGGAIVSLSILFDGLTELVTLIEKDSNVGAVWQTIVSGDAPELAKKIEGFDLTEENAKLLFSSTFAPDDVLRRAFSTIVRNRVQRGGILAPGASMMRNGENGRGLKSRWYPETLRNRLLDLHKMHSSICFQSGDGIKFMQDNASNADMVWFIDPPYTVAGRRLYSHSQIDHEKLFEETGNLAGTFLMTYDDTPEVRALANKHDFTVAKVAMKNTHHKVMSELLISRDLSWSKT